MFSTANNLADLGQTRFGLYGSYILSTCNLNIFLCRVLMKIDCQNLHFIIWLAPRAGKMNSSESMFRFATRAGKIRPMLPAFSAPAKAKFFGIIFWPYNKSSGHIINPLLIKLVRRSIWLDIYIVLSQLFSDLDVTLCQ